MAIENEENHVQGVRNSAREYRAHPYQRSSQARASSRQGNPSTSSTSQPWVERENAPGGIETNIGNDGDSHGGGTSFGIRGGISESVLVRTLREQVADLKAQNQLLQSLIDRQTLLAVPRVCEWACILPHMRVLPKQLMLGLDPEKNRMRPNEEHVKEAILDAFNVAVDDRRVRKHFDHAWTSGLKRKVNVHICNRRGRFSTNARMELWRLLGIPKPINGTPEDIERWKESMVPLHEELTWRKDGDDPYGADAFIGAIGFVKFGRGYNNSMQLKLLPGQLAWFSYVLDLAMQGDFNMKGNGFHEVQIVEYEKNIMQRREWIHKIELILPGDMFVSEELGFDDAE